MSATPMQVENVPQPDDAPHVFRVVVRGELDMATSPRLAEHLDGLIASGGTLLIIDASEVRFLDSSGLRVIVSADARLDALGGRLLIEGMSGAVQQVLEVSGLLERYRGSGAT